MPVKKMRVEVFDGSGNRYTITFEGNVTREKALRLLDLIELLGGMPSVNPNLEETASAHSKFDKLRSILEKHFPIVWFSSKDAQLVYEQEFKEPLSLSTVSTYLSRLADRGVLAKSGTSNRRRYRIVTQLSRSTLGFYER
jgi:DNA-binding transcriptional ArsR family regulator